MEKHKHLLENAVLSCTFLLILLWCYTATSKLITFTSFKSQLSLQHFNPLFTSILAWALPLTELITAITLLFAKTRKIGLQLSFILMLLFTGYVGLALIGYFKEKPCSCGGVLQQLGWTAHFYFNLFFLFTSISGMIANKKLSTVNALNQIQ